MGGGKATPRYQRGRQPGYAFGKGRDALKHLMTHCGSAGLIVLGLACATVQTPNVRTANPTPFGNCSIAADRVSARADRDLKVWEYRGQTVVTCAGKRTTVYSNLTIRQQRDGAVEMTADSVELR